MPKFKFEFLERDSRWLKYVSGVGRQNVEKNALVTAEVDADQVDMTGVSIEHEHGGSGRWY